jgi:hypothetical protein
MDTSISDQHPVFLRPYRTTGVANCRPKDMVVLFRKPALTGTASSLTRPPTIVWNGTAGSVAAQYGAANQFSWQTGNAAAHQDQMVRLTFEARWYQ